jgi:hypothetical protein
MSSSKCNIISAGQVYFKFYSLKQVNNSDYIYKEGTNNNNSKKVLSDSNGDQMLVHP